MVQTSATESPKAMQIQTGIDAPHFSKWKAGQIPGAAIAAKFARAYDKPVLEAFVEAGFLTAEEAKQRPTAAPSLSSLSDDQLVDEIRERLRKAGEHGGDTAATKDPSPGNVTQIGRAARGTGKVSKGQQRRRDADRAGEPDPDDPDDHEGR